MIVMCYDRPHNFFSQLIDSFRLLLSLVLLPIHVANFMQSPRQLKVEEDIKVIFVDLHHPPSLLYIDNRYSPLQIILNFLG